MRAKVQIQTGNLDGYAEVRQGPEGVDFLHFEHMPPSFSCLLKVKRGNGTAQIRRALSEELPLLPNLSLGALNHLLFRCEPEERDIKPSRGPYALSNFGPFRYSGLAGVIFLANQLKRLPSQNHELLQNVRQGDWLIDYLLIRM